MNSYKVLFVGIGSIATQHIRNLGIISKKEDIFFEIDALRQSKSTEIIDGINNIYYSIDEVPDDYDIVFITNPTDKHLETLCLLHDKGKHFFIEKPAVSIDQTEIAERINYKDGSVHYVACPLRYNAVIRYIKENISPDEVISVRCISSSYLPDWRPGTDYRKVYSSHRDMGGGVSIDLIHEWDYITFLFGFPERVSCFKGKISNLEIDSDDYAIYIAEYRDKIAELHLDYFGRKTIRTIQLFTNEETIIGDIANNKVTYLCSGHTIEFEETREESQQRELLQFIDIISGKKKCDNDLKKSLKVMNITQGIITNTEQ